MYTAIFLAFLASAYAQISLPGTCGDENTQLLNTTNTQFSNILNTQFLNLTALATWQEVQRIPNHLELGQCSTISLREPTNSSFPYVLSIREVANRTVRYHNGSVVAVFATGKVAVNFTGVMIDLRVMKTDFKNYALIYGCRNVANNTKEVYGWKLSRNSTLSSTDVSTINAAVNGTDLQNVTWSTVSHAAEACKVNSAVTSQMSILLCILAVIVAMEK